jgi:hypothetical protein
LVAYVKAGMRLLFRGWRREVMEHRHSVIPVSKGSNAQGLVYQPSRDDGPLTWTSSLQALGKVDDLSLNGSFLVEFNFEEEELRNWLRQFVRENPEAAVRLLAEMQGEAILALARKTEERISERDVEEIGEF